MKIDMPHENTYCGNGFPDWLEVNLIDKCNGTCEWCVEKRGWKPVVKADYRTLVKAVLNTERKNIVLLGGEPTLYPDLKSFVSILVKEDRNVYITTNGSMLNPEWIKRNLQGITGMNLSIHSFDLYSNSLITGIHLKEKTLKESLETLHDMNVSIRFNCNCIEGYIDSWDNLVKYIHFAKDIGADKIRFAELKFDNDKFVDLYEITGHKYGTNDDPYKK